MCHAQYITGLMSDNGFNVGVEIVLIVSVKKDVRKSDLFCPSSQSPVSVRLGQLKHETV